MNDPGSGNPDSPIWTSGKTDIYRTGTWRSAVPDYVNPPSPCHSACPVDGNIALWIQQIKEGDYHGAWLSLTDNNPFPAIAGRICHHPCEPVCNRGHYDEPVSICALERFIGDLAIRERWTYPLVPCSNKETIAVIGAGPAGLSAAYHLRRRGYAVVLLEAKVELGGLMRYGIPPYRLAKDVLDWEIQRIIGLGMEVRLGTAVRSRDELEALAGEFDAIYLAMGADTPKRLPALNYSKDWVLDGAEYLARTDEAEMSRIGSRVVVIGGGSAAMDVARSARRHDREITILSLEPEALLPCQEEEVVDAREEGIRLITGAMLQSVLEIRGGLALSCVRLDFLPGSRRGEFTIQPIPDTEFVIEADTIISSIGQDPAPHLLNGMLDRNGALLKIDAHMQTSRKGIFAGGDLASMERFVTHAIGMGKHAAAEIHSYLYPDDVPMDMKHINRYLRTPRTSATRDRNADITMDAINLYYHDRVVRNHQHRVPVAERLRNFNEIQTNLSPQQAREESGRCFSCGNCIFCDNCFNYCPDMAIVKIEQGYEVRLDYCKGCGLCVRECPTAAIAMFEDRQ